MLDDNYNSEEITNYITIPINSLDNNTIQLNEDLKIIKNVFIKTLPNGSMCIINPNDLNVDLVPDSTNLIYSPEKNDDLPSNSDPQPQTSESEQPSKPIYTYKCTKCRQEFGKLPLYKKHMLWHRNINKFKCDKCSMAFNVESNLKIHMAMHSEGTPNCPICGITFHRTASLRSHLMVHQVEELFSCEECSAEFEKEDELNKHLQCHANPDSGNSNENDDLICSYCKVQFDDVAKYKEHISHHIKVKKMVFSGKRNKRSRNNKEYPHVCYVCQKSFSKASLLQRHLRVHSGERPFVCHFCNKGFNQKGTLQIHLNKHTGVKPYQCTLCLAKFNQKGNLRAHVEKTHTAPTSNVKTYKCAYCTCIFKKIASLNVHITKSHSINSNDTNSEATDDISSIMNQLKELEKHTTTITPNMKEADKEIVEQNKKILSEIKEGNNVSNLNYVRVAESFLDGNVRRYLVKQRKINDVRWYMCNFCNKEFKKPSDLIRHIRTHTREKPFSCSQCGSAFSLKSSLFTHIQTHIGKKDYQCVVCCKKFTSVRTLNLHLKKHSQSEISHYKCKKCDKSFSSIDKITKHNECHEKNDKQIDVVMKQPLLQTPNGIISVYSIPKKPGQYCCEICNYKFNKSGNFKRHMLRHKGEKEFKCDKCSKSFFTAQGLWDHILKHTGIKNYTCKICNKKFSTASYLKRHYVTHNTLKPFLCPYCNKKFKSVSLCRRHIKIHKVELLKLTENQGENLENSQVIPKQKTEITIPENTIEIMSQSNTEDQSNQLQTILINTDDLQLMDGNLYSGSQIKFQVTDNFFLNSLNELQENVFNLDSINTTELVQTSEIFNTNQEIFSEEITENFTKPKKLEDNLLNIQFLSNDLNFDAPITVSIPSPLPDLPELETEISDETSMKVTNEILEQVKKEVKKRATKRNVNKNDKVRLRECKYCGKTFKRPSDLERHIRTHTGEKPFPCDKCDKRFSLKSTLVSHLRTHNPIGNKEFNCNVCNSFFSSKSSLKVHMNIHKGNKPHQCNFCPSKFRTEAHRKAHENSSHINGGKKKAQSKSVKVANLLASVAMEAVGQDNQEQQDSVPIELIVQDDQIQLPELSTPLNILNETADNQDLIQIDPLSFQQLQTGVLLQDQFLTPVIELDYGSVFNLNSIDKTQELQTEEIIEKERNLECDICHKKYASKDVLRKHKKIHGINRKFPCMKCDRGFDTQEQFDKHQKIHDGIRPFQCLFCNNSFSKTANLRTHIKRIHNVSNTKNLEYFSSL